MLMFRIVMDFSGIFFKEMSMKKRTILLIAVISLSTAGLLHAQEGNLGVEYEVEYTCKYIWYGFEGMAGKAAILPRVSVDWFQTGLSTTIQAAYAGEGASSNGGRSTVNRTEYQYTLAYDRSIFEGEVHTVDFGLNFTYRDFIDNPNKGDGDELLSRGSTDIGDTQEVGAYFALPNICSAGVVPSYYIGRIWPNQHNSVLPGQYGGWIHIFGLNYDLTLPTFIYDMPEPTLNLMANVVYNDGFGSATVKHDWSHATFGAALPIDVGQVTVKPGIYWQLTMEKSVNNSSKDILYGGVTISSGF
jgi:hypothetical protein